MKTIKSIRNHIINNLSFFLAILIFSAAIIAFYWLSSAELNQNIKCERCNVILISVDTFGAKHLGIYGYNEPTSPFLDKLAKERGVVFDNAIVQASWTLASHTAMLTSKYPATFGVWDPFDKLPDEATTIAEVLRDNGYTTQAFSNGFFVQPEWGFDQGFDHFNGSLDPKNFHDSPKIFQDALSWINSYKDKKPFFLFMRPWNMNSPGIPSVDLLNLMGVDAKSWKPVTDAEIIAANTRPSGPTEEENFRFRTEYDAKVLEVDRGLEQFFKGLEDWGLLKNTVVIVTADHGEEFGEHGTTRFHAALYDETIHVPLIIVFPKSKPQRIPQVVESRFIPATIVDFVDVKPRAPFEGKSLVDYIRGVGTDSVALSVSALGHDWFFKLDQNNKTMLEKIRPQILDVGKSLIPKVNTLDRDVAHSSSAMSAKWQIVHNFDGNFEIYDLKNDSEEKDNLYPKWASLPSEDRREALEVMKALGSDVPVPCGIYCPEK